MARQFYHEKYTGILWTVGSVGPRTEVGVFGKKKILYLLEFELRTVQSVA
jgi:hypothetical protein